jgi:hypothetical protein
VSADELRPPGREILDIAHRARTPSDEDRDRVYQALMAGLGGSAAVGTTKVATAAAKIAAKSSLAWLKWALPFALLSSASVGTYAWVARRNMAPISAPVLETTALQARPVTMLPAAEAAFDPTVPAPATSREPATTRSPKSPSTKMAADDLGQELSLLHQAHAKWRSGNAAHALELAREHARRYPGSQLRFERNALEVRALCALGREAEARKIADQLRLQAPNSPMSGALKDSCVGK